MEWKRTEQMEDKAEWNGDRERGWAEQVLRGSGCGGTSGN